MREREETTWTAEWNILRMSLKFAFRILIFHPLIGANWMNFYKDHPEEIPIENEFVGYRADGDVVEDFKGNLYLILCDPGMHPIGSSVMRQSELDGAVKLGKRIVYVDELLDHIPESSPYVEN